MGLFSFFHNALTQKPQATNRDYVQRPQSVGQAYNNIGAVERMMPGGAGKATLGQATKKPRGY